MIDPNTPGLRGAGFDHDAMVAAASRAGELDNILSKAWGELTEDERTLMSAFSPKQVNPCNGCTLCCTAPSIGSDEAHKPMEGPKAACQQCSMLKEGGCSVYDKRPSICRGYLCAYAIGIDPNWPKDTGVCWSHQVAFSECGRYMDWTMTGHALDAEEALNDERVRRSIIAFLHDQEAPAVILRDDKLAMNLTLLPGDIGSARTKPREQWPLLLHIAPVDPNDPLRQNIDSKQTRQAVVRLFPSLQVRV